MTERSITAALMTERSITAALIHPELHCQISESMDMFNSMELDEYKTEYLTGIHDDVLNFIGGGRFPDKPKIRLHIPGRSGRPLPPVIVAYNITMNIIWKEISMKVVFVSHGRYKIPVINSRPYYRTSIEFYSVPDHPVERLYHAARKIKRTGDFSCEDGWEYHSGDK